MPLFKSVSGAGRPRSGQNSSVRGRISGPIMIDDEFPIRQPGAGIAHEGIPVDLSSSQPDDSPPALSRDAEPEAFIGAQAASTQSPGVAAQPSQTTSSPYRRDNVRSSTLRYSNISHAHDGTPGSHPNRKKSSFRSALSKLFGRKRKEPGSRESGAETPFFGTESPEHHRSQLPAARDPVIDEAEPKRSTSLPITEYDRALRSHSIGPDDMLAIESARNSVQVEPGVMRKRAASSSLILSPGMRDFNGEMIGLTPRPVSAYGEIRAVGTDAQNPDEIGRALSIYEPTAKRRRSKSLSGLPEVSEVQPTARNRSDEIRYWRESFNPHALSPTTETTNDGTSHVDEGTESPPDTPRTAPQSFPFSPGDFPTETLPETPRTLPQPFPYVSEEFNAPAVSEMSLQDRVVALEAHTRKLERLISQLFELVPGIGQYEGAPRSVPLPPPSVAAFAPIYQTALPDQLPSSRESDESFGDAYTYVGSIPAPPRVPPMASPNNSTVREATSLPTLPRDAVRTLNSDHYTTFKALLDTERAKRQVLESQVTKLSYRLNRLSRTSHGLDSQKKGMYSAFEDDDDDFEPATAATDEYGSDAFRTPREEYPAAAHQVLESHGGDDDDFKEDQDATSTAERKKAPRTLSLGQLTIPKPKRIQAETGVSL